MAVENNEHWIWKFDRWVIETEKEYIYKPLGEKLADNIVGGLKQLGVAVWDKFVPFLPDLIGYGAVGTGAFIIISSLAGRGMMKPLGIFAGVSIVAVCILGAN